jgi:O-antigen/teichoic acid export membrane protein
VIMRDRIASGMRWTVWLSALSVPFSYATTILLARISPEAIGTYGLLMAYIGVVLGLFYLGGDAVSIKFIPELDPADRSAFLISYYLIVCLATLPWIAAAFVWPAGLRYLFSDQISSPFRLFLIVISPLCILSSLVGAALKGSLEIKWAQVILRLITIGSFAVYISLYFGARPFLASNYRTIIWGTYLGLSAIAAAVGLFLLFFRARNRVEWHKPRFFLPRGFWRYTLSLQQLSVLAFFTQRVDVLLVLNFGNLALLGRYVAVMTLAESIRLINRYFLDALLPSLTNMVAARNFTAASNVFGTHMRILFLVSTATTLGLILFAGPVTALLGQKYAGLAPLVALVSLIIGLSSPGGLAGPVLTSIGKQQQAVWVGVVDVVLYISLFIVLWAKWQLLGAIVAYGIECVITAVAGLILANLCSPFELSGAREYVSFGLIAILATAAARFTAIDLVKAALAWAVAMGIFMLCARYSVAECIRLIQFFSPVRLTGRNSCV